MEARYVERRAVERAFARRNWRDGVFLLWASDRARRAPLRPLLAELGGKCFVESALADPIESGTSGAGAGSHRDWDS